MEQLTHFDESGRAKMVDVTAKKQSERTAVAEGCVHMKRETLSLIKRNEIAKGDVLTVAKIAGILGAKSTSTIIPMCHPIPVSHVDLSFDLNEADETIQIRCEVKSVGKTGVEMEALTATCVSALTIYDMCKAVDREMTLSDIRLMEKRGGRSGTWHRGEQ